jgi:superfamily II DNA or RNA helicase
MTDVLKLMLLLCLEYESKKTKQEQSKEKLLPLTQEQHEAIDFIYSNWKQGINSLCALDIGMGKTRIACEIIALFFDSNKKINLKGYVLVFCSTSGVRDSIWRDTLKAYNIKTIILSGEQFARIKIEKSKKLATAPRTVYLITYANILKKDNIEYLRNTPPNFIVFDEFHSITNNARKRDHEYRTKIMELPYRLRLALTATPFVNEEMESVISYGILNNVEIVRKFIAAAKDERELLIQRVRKIPFFFVKNNVYNLTPVSEWFISIPMSVVLYQDYKKICEEYKDNGMSRQHQVGKMTVSSSLCDKAIKNKMMANVEAGKIEALKAIISNLPDDNKIIIFDNYKDTLKYIQRQQFIRHLKPVLYLGGSETDRKKSISEFTKDDCRALLTTRQEGGEGMNFQIANHVVLLNCWYTVKDVIQMIGRVKRKGQTKPVYAYILGYNLANCINSKNTLDFFLPEDLNFYKAIQRKIEMCEKWGIEVKAKLPRLKAFFDASSFELEFTVFLKDILSHEWQKFKDMISLEENEELVDDTETEDNETYYDDFAMQMQDHDKINSVSFKEKNKIPRAQLIKRKSDPT